MVDFKALRKKIELTQAELAEKVGVSENTIQNWESGKIIPKGENLNNYLRGLRITDHAERKWIISELTESTYIKDIEIVDNVPYFLFDDKQDQIDKIKNCFASAEELDMLGYEYYLTPKGRIISDVQIRFPMEYAFFEKHGGFNQTMKIMNDAKERLGKLKEDAINYAEENPGCEYRLVSMEKEKIIDKLGKLIGYNDLKKQIINIYNLIKAIDVCEEPYGKGGNTFARLNNSQEINKILQNSSQILSEKRNFGVLDGYILLKDDSLEKPNISNVELTERGKLLIEMVESNEYSIRRNVG